VPSPGKKQAGSPSAKRDDGSRKTGRKPSLKSLEVIDRLEVGPVKTERKRLIAPYRVFQNGTSDAFNLIYSFEEEVFDPERPDSMNLADMIASQVAINYGLFCREIVFHGSFEGVDRKFVLDMMENTAREIYVKKFLEPNPFLVGPANEIPSVRRKRYSRAKVTFRGPSADLDTNRSGTRIEPNEVRGNSDRYAVLSSGGKDSLLTFGLLRELGQETHPIFINESGRHWFTALNAYRHFVANYPETSRVWTNSDRMFAWMLRHFPFVRSDFAEIRSDEYPVRLWTVAVFLFGAIPLLRKRGIGRLTIGDEYDTTSRKSLDGITHYNGLYDQSRYFDNAMTRYFRGKGWGVVQFSALRSLSELMIQKILVHRYPDLQSHQMSCHAAHPAGNRIYPCGRCEKCRRIVGMLVALGADPGHCGYSADQVERCLKDLATRGVHQESAGIDQLMYLLDRKKVIPKTAEGVVHGKERSEIMKVRIDPERSPTDEIPDDIRRPLYRILLKHASGAVRREGTEWRDYDLLNDPTLSETASPNSRNRARKSNVRSRGNRNRPESDFLLGELTWTRAHKRFKEVDVALLPVGSIEQHGPHLPLDTDAFDAEYLASQVAALCSNPKPIVLPLIPYGVSYHHDDFSGTISVSPDTLSKLVYDVGMSVVRHGIKKLVIVNAHGGNVPALKFAAQMINRDAHIFTCVESGETSDTDVNRIIETPNDVHAGEIETSTTMAVRPDSVDVSRAQKFVPRFSSRYLDFSSKRSVEWFGKTAKISRSGVLGDPTLASQAKGKQIWEVMIKHLAEFVEDLKNMTLGEIYERRY
jgi:creatinine amidohydrolase/Fe(II)-dependent formamide hydrolase-like protein